MNRELLLSPYLVYPRSLPTPPGLKVIQQATGHLLSIETCRQQCEVVPIDGNSDGESHPDDALILAMQDAAVAHAEAFTGLSLQIRTYEMAFDEFPCGGIELLRPPLIELVTFTAGSGSDNEVDPDTYVLDDYREPAQLVPVSDWPSVSKATNTIKVRYRAGYSSEVDPDSDAQTLPYNIRAAILLMLGHLYANREDSAEKALSSIPQGFEALLRPMRVRLGMA